MSSIRWLKQSPSICIGSLEGVLEIIDMEKMKVREQYKISEDRVCVIK